MAFVEHKAPGELGTIRESGLTQIKLSEAIRIGARIRPQCVGAFFRNGASCAWGAAWEGAGGEYNQRLFIEEIMKKFPAFESLGELRKDIADKNDGGDTREQIADWLEAQGY